MQPGALSVSDLNEYVRRSLAGDPMLRDVYLRGEISNFKQHVSGHLYFSLKDEQSRIACVMFRQHTLFLRLAPKDGMKVVLRGTVGLYTASGTYQFYAEEMAPDGLGDLYQRFLALKDRLSREGLFDSARKQPLPLLPQAIGVATSATGAVLHDIKTVVGRRMPGLPLILRPCLVQGEGAARDIVKALEELAAQPQVDVIILGRGGGSLEDLWAFNEEIVVRAVAACPKPVISAVGHETDVTLTDFAADVRAATPSAAAEMAAPDRRQLHAAADALARRLHYAAQAIVSAQTASLAQTEKRLQQLRPDRQLAAFQQRLSKAQTRLARTSLPLALGALQNRFTQVQARLERAVGDRMLAAHAMLEAYAVRLRSAGPQQTLARGYVIALDGKKPVTSVEKIPERMTLIFHDGQAQVQTLDRRKEGQTDGTPS